MTALPELGAVLAERTVRLTRAELLAYAEASGDHNPIHRDDAVARAVGLPGVIAHGMLTMGLAVQPVVDWADSLAAGADGERARIVEYGVRFTRMVEVDAVEGVELRITATVGAVDAAARVVRVDLAVRVGEQTVLGKAQARVAVP